MVEAAVAMVTMGVAMMVLWQTVGGARLKENQMRAQTDIERGRMAVLAFVAVHHRFPCPAAQPDGWESCEGRPSTGFVPHQTLGLPEPGDPRVRYALDPVIAASDSRFMVLVNDQVINAGSVPRVARVPLHSLLTTDYDGVLDLCEGLARVAAHGSAAFTLENRPEATASAPLWSGSPATSSTSAAQVSDHLGCRAMVAVAGRGQYNAHLAAAVLSRATQDHRVQSEVAYALNYLNLAEGAWSLSNGMYVSMKNWAKLIQVSSALDANIWTDPVRFASLHAKALVDRSVELVGVAARSSNLARYIDNLQNAQDNRSAHHDLVRDTLEVYTSTTQHALIGSTSKWFLREQRNVPRLPPIPGPAGDFRRNEAAQALTTAGEAGANVLGHGERFAPYTRLPEAPSRSPIAVNR